MDLTSGFYNIVVSEEDRKFTAFTTPMGLYEFNRLPQGLCNSPASFMQLMTNIFGDQNFLTLLCYLDDLLMYTPNEEEAVKRLELMFTRLRCCKAIVQPNSCTKREKGPFKRCILGWVRGRSFASTGGSIAFVSKALTHAQTKYPVHRLEFLALKWSVCDKFSHWLKGHNFTVWTDNNPLTYILTKPKLDACEQRWVLKLAPYSVSIRYIPGSRNMVTDSLSRQPFVRQSVGQRLISEPYGALLGEADQVREDTIQNTFRMSANTCNVEHLPWDLGMDDRAAQWLTQGAHQLLSPGLSPLPVFSLRELQEKQQDDKVLSRVLFH
ncbi:hypothetical protein QTP86_027628, partial [Hemibagrus guttatus]